MSRLCLDINLNGKRYNRYFDSLAWYYPIPTGDLSFPFAKRASYDSWDVVGLKAFDSSLASLKVGHFIVNAFLDVNPHSVNPVRSGAVTSHHVWSPLCRQICSRPHAMSFSISAYSVVVPTRVVPCRTIPNEWAYPRQLRNALCNLFKRI